MMRLRLLWFAWIGSGALALCATTFAVVTSHEARILLKVIETGEYQSLQGRRIRIAPVQVEVAYHAATTEGDELSAQRHLARAIAIEHRESLAAMVISVVCASLAAAAYLWRRHLIKRSKPPNYIQALTRAILVTEHAHTDAGSLIAYLRDVHTCASDGEEEKVRLALRRVRRAWHDVPVEALSEELEESFVTLRAALEEIAQQGERS